MSSKVTIYSTPTCGFCYMAKDYLKEKGVTFEDINIADPAQGEAMQYVIKHAGQAATPYIVIGDEGILGFDRPAIDAALEKLKPQQAA